MNATEAEIWPDVRVTWQALDSEQPLTVGLRSRTGYSTPPRTISPDESDKSLVFNLPHPFAGSQITCWARKGRDNRKAVILDLVLVDGETAVGTLDRSESIEWACHAPGIDKPSSGKVDYELLGAPDNLYDLWRFIHELGQTEQDCRLFRGESTIYEGPIQSGMVRQWGLNGEPLARHERTLLREARRYVDIGDQDQLIAEWPTRWDSNECD